MTTEKIGRKYQKVRFGVHSRRVGSNDWGGMSHYRTFDEAVKAIESMGKPLDLGGGFTMEFPKGTEPYEYRIVREISQCEVMHTEFISI